MDLVISNHDQVTKTAPELAPPPNYHTTPTEGRLSSRQIIVHRSPTRRVFNDTGLELVTRPATIRYPDPSATADHKFKRRCHSAHELRCNRICLYRTFS
ncbi:hypothetical protein TNCV_3170731 [Trichonephila clavipes]|nr:hypothetical protein TNCV_3170731 [Trichonephila clavipes]